MRDSYDSFNSLVAHEIEDVDYRIVCKHRKSRVSIVAPHGGNIEPNTSQIATMIAGNIFNLYCFEGLKSSRNFSDLHITSTHFDEPRCLDLLSTSHHVVTVHGCLGDEPKIYLGGLDYPLKMAISGSLISNGYVVECEGHSFPGCAPSNICNRGLSGMGVQLELTRCFRDKQNLAAFAATVAGSCHGILASVTDPKF